MLTASDKSLQATTTDARAPIGPVPMQHESFLRWLRPADTHINTPVPVDWPRIRSAGSVSLATTSACVEALGTGNEMGSTVACWTNFAALSVTLHQSRLPA